jgi:protein-export membrane protein SecD
MQKLYWRIILIFLVIVVGAIYLAPSFRWYSQPRAEQEKMRARRHPLAEKILNLGLDLQGGIHLVLELQTDKLPDDKPETVREAVERAVEIIRNRVDQYGLAEPLIVTQGEKWIVVQMPGVKDREQAKSLIGRTALLEFRIVELSQEMGSLQEKIRELGLGPDDFRAGAMPESIKPHLPPGTELLVNREGGYYLVKDKAEMTGASLVNARVEMGGQYSGFPVVALEFSPEGAERFAEVTESNVERQLAIVLDGVVQSAPKIRSF